jgi:hypothetical protein
MGITRKPLSLHWEISVLEDGYSIIRQASLTAFVLYHAEARQASQAVLMRDEKSRSRQLSSTLKFSVPHRENASNDDILCAIQGQFFVQKSFRNVLKHRNW